MITYKKFRHTPDSWGYAREGRTVSRTVVPPEVLEKLQYSDNVLYDDQPGVLRCLFCEAPRSHTRLVTGVMVDMCASHYYSENIGRIVAQLRKVKQEREKQNGPHATPSKRRKTKRLQRPAAKSPADNRQDAAPGGTPDQGQGTEEQ